MDSVDFLLGFACITLNLDESRYNYNVLRSKVRGWQFDLHKQFIIPKFGEILLKQSKYSKEIVLIKLRSTIIRFTINDSIFFAIFYGFEKSLCKNNDENLELKLSCLAPFLFHGLDRRLGLAAAPVL